MSECVKVSDKYYIASTASVADPRRLILKHGDLFGVFDRFGDILPIEGKDQGLYFEGTRFLSLYELKIDNARPLLLSSGVDEDNILMTIDLTNPDIHRENNLCIKKDSAHMMRSRFLRTNRLHEHIRIKNFGQIFVILDLTLSFEADFRDIFEIRGADRNRRGAFSVVEYADRECRLSYEGLDGITRTTLISFGLTPVGTDEGNFHFKLALEPGETQDFFVTIHCLQKGEKQIDAEFGEAYASSHRELRQRNINCADVVTSNNQFNETLKRSLSDINMMLTGTEHGLYPYGGIPWFCCPFGRDAIITALECLWIKPSIARGVLLYLAASQALDFDKRKIAEPGKIMHETRKGEMAMLDEIPFGLYYGSVDSTPLFVILAGAYWKRTEDTELIRRLWSNIEAALLWMEKYGDPDMDGFLEYVPDKTGLRNQGWKDSQDSVFHKDGTLAEGPIALCEVQGYYYASKIEAAAMASALDKADMAEKLLKEAAALKEKFNRLFWDEKSSTYVLALDGEKKPCRIKSSNAGHALFTGIADNDKAAEISETLISEPLFSGWGIRTVAAGEALYNPMSYHNGSIWPHDNAIISLGLSAYGFKKESIKVFSGIYNASLYMEFLRLPELFCGFHRRKGVAPTLYPVACSPQTWAAGSLIYMLQAALGIYFEAKEKKIILKQPVLPEFLDHVCLNNLMFDEGMGADLVIRRYNEDVSVEVARKHKNITIQILK